MNVTSTSPNAAPGPITPCGKAIAARNATTHGLFARDVVLTALGEDPAAFDALLQQLLTQLPPRHLLERHYLEQIAAASWRLRRLHRWQAQIYEDPALTEDERLDKLDKVLRHETALTRQIDRAVRMMNRDLAWLFQNRARDDALYFRNVTDVECRQDPDLAIDVQQHVWKQARSASPDAGLDYERLDNTHAAPADSQICQNEPPPAPEPEEISDYDRHVSYIHPNGCPVYLDENTWHALQRMRAGGDHECADKHDADYRTSFLDDQLYHRDQEAWLALHSEGEDEE